MRELVRRSALLFSLILLAIEGRAEATNPSTFGIGQSLSSSSDSDNFSALKYGILIAPLYSHGGQLLGAGIQRNRFSQSGWAIERNVFGVTSKNIDPLTALGHNATLGYARGANRSLIVTDTSYGFRINKVTTAEVMVNREFVETRSALSSDVYLTFLAGSIEAQIAERLSAVLLAGNTMFSDHNSRPTLRAKLVYDLAPDYGVNLQLRYRTFKSTDTAVAQTYFNPARYDETLAGLGFRRRIEGWAVVGTLGRGVQHVDHGSGTATQLVDLTITSPQRDRHHHVRLRATHAVSANTSGPDYSYRHFQGEWIIPFN